MSTESQHSAAKDGSKVWLRSFVGIARFRSPVGVALARDAGWRVRLPSRTDFTGRWCCPGGGIDLGGTAEVIPLFRVRLDRVMRPRRRVTTGTMSWHWPSSAVHSPANHALPAWSVRIDARSTPKLCPR